MNLDYLRKLANRKRFTAEEKEMLRAWADAHGIKFNKSCPDCWRDLVAQLYRIATRAAAPVGGKTPKGYQLKPGTDFILIVGGRTWRVSERTLTDKTAEEWLRYGMSRTHFAAMPETESETETDTDTETETETKDEDNGEDTVQ